MGTTEKSEDNKTEKSEKDESKEKETVSDEIKIKSEQSAIRTPKKKLKSGQLVVTVLKAKDIEKKGMFGKPDPYVRVTLDKQKAKSVTVNNNYNPEWNFTSTFEIDGNTSDEICISLCDDDIGKDDTLGDTTIDIRSIQEEGNLPNRWVSLNNCKSGEILLSVEFLSLSENLVAEKPVAATFSEKETSFEATEILQEATKEDVEKEPSIQEPQAKDKTQKESFGDVAKTTDVRGAKGLNDILKQEKEVLSSKPEEEKEEIDETKKELKVTDEIEPEHEPEVDIIASSSIAHEKKEEPFKLSESGKIKIIILKAKDIEKNGMFGKADPYVKLTMGAQKAKLKTVKNNHNPEWNFPATFDIGKETSEVLNIELFDEDIGKDDSLGSTSLDIRTIMEEYVNTNKWIPLKNCKSGEVLLSAEFIPESSRTTSITRIF